jgi:hypothetical protein
MDFPNLFSNEKSGGPDPRRVDRTAWLRSMVDRGGVNKRARRCLVGARRAGHCGPRRLVGYSGEAVVERRRGDRDERWRLELIARAEERERELRSEGERGGEGQGCSGVYIGGWGASERGNV